MVLADQLGRRSSDQAIKQHSSAKLTTATLRMIEQASTLAAADPLAVHPVHLLFRPLSTQRSKGEGHFRRLYRQLQCGSRHRHSCGFGLSAPGASAAAREGSAQALRAPLAGVRFLTDRDEVRSRVRPHAMHRQHLDS